MNERVRESIRFLVVTLSIFTLLYGVVAWGSGWKKMTDFTASGVVVALEAMGTSVNQVMDPAQTLLRVQGFDILISDLCTGWFEICLLIGAIAATRHASRNQQLIGMGVALLGGFLVNQVRVVASIQQVVYTSGNWATFTHDVLFRFSMLLVVLGGYALWLKWVNEHPIKEKKSVRKKGKRK